ncbi:hypothetical protein Tco_1460194, partial [Tanacetum coccineum]
SGGGVVDLTVDEDLVDEDGDIGMGDSTGVLVSLGDEIFSGGKKSRESNIGDSKYTGDGGKTAAAEANLGYNYHGKHFGKQYYHGEQLNASLMGNYRSDIGWGTDVPVER